MYSKVEVVPHVVMLSASILPSQNVLMCLGLRPVTNPAAYSDFTMLISPVVWLVILILVIIV